ncbi:DUF262 domain-containing protein [Lentzea chajnantorensis]
MSFRQPGGFVMQTSATNKRLRTLLTGIRDNTVIPNPHFQRRLVWSNDHKLAFLKTVLEGLPFPEIFTSAGDVNPDTGDGTELIVDGQQRITTLYQYFNAHVDLKLQGQIPPYAELSQPQKIAFLEYEVVVRDLGPLSEEETREIFNRINSTKYSLNAMEVNNSRFDGELKKFAEKMAGDEFFESHGFFTALDGRRMNDVRFTLTLIITLMSGYFNLDEAHEDYLERYNDDFPEREATEVRLRKIFDFISSCNFDRRSRIWQKGDMLTAAVEIDRIINVGGHPLDPLRTHDAIGRFYDEVNSVTTTTSPAVDAAEYYRRVRSGINNRSNRISRAEALRGRLESIVD